MSRRPQTNANQPLIARSFSRPRDALLGRVAPALRRLLGGLRPLAAFFSAFAAPSRAAFDRPAPFARPSSFSTTFAMRVLIFSASTPPSTTVSAMNAAIVPPNVHHEAAGAARALTISSPTNDEIRSRISPRSVPTSAAPVSIARLPQSPVRASVSVAAASLKLPAPPVCAPRLPSSPFEPSPIPLQKPPGASAVATRECSLTPAALPMPSSRHFVRCSCSLNVVCAVFTRSAASWPAATAAARKPPAVLSHAWIGSAKTCPTSPEASKSRAWAVSAASSASCTSAAISRTSSSWPPRTAKSTFIAISAPGAGSKCRSRRRTAVSGAVLPPVLRAPEFVP